MAPEIFDQEIDRSVAAHAYVGSNAPPVAVTVPLVRRIGDASCTVVITPAEVDGGSFDPNVFHPWLNPSPAAPTEGAWFALSLSQTTFTGLGDHSVVLTATDQAGLSSSAETAVRVVAPAHAQASPSRINRNANGRYITAYLEFGGSACGRGAGDVDASTVTVQAIDPVTSVKLHVAPGSPTEIGDGNGNGVLDRSVRFDRAVVQAWFPSESQATLRFEGRFLDGTYFEGDDASLQIIDPGTARRLDP